MIQIPGYLIKREIGAGGMATVFLAVQTSLEREVALKVMNPAMVSDPTFSRRFMQEARTLASLAHPNIVAVYDVGITDEKLHYFSMQHLPHGDFLHRIRDGIGEREVLRVIAGVARALGFAHQRGFVHRDVAPGNVLFDANGNPVLTDFGIARAVSKTSRITNAGVSVGTSHYMSPEQARGGDVDGRSDLYSLGAVCFEALTGQAPYEGDDGFAIAYAHVFEPVPRLPQHLAHWQALIDRAMAKDPAQRFQNADEFVLALAELEQRIGPSPDATVAIAQPGIGATLNMSAPTQILANPITDPAARQAAAASAAAAVAQGDIGAELSALRERAKSGQHVLNEAAAQEAAPALPPPARPRPLWPWFAGLGAVAALGMLAFGVFNARVDDARVTPPAVVSAQAPAATTPVAATAATTAAVPTGVAPTGVAPSANPETPDAAIDDLDRSAFELLGIDAPDIDDELRLAIETTVVDPVAELLRLARLDLAGQRLTLPAGRNATDRYRLVLRIDRDNAAAKAGLVETARALYTMAEGQLAAGKVDEYFTTAARAIEIAGAHDRDGTLRTSVDAKRRQLIDAALKEGGTALERWDGATARAAYQRALKFEPGNAAASRGLKLAESVGRPGYVFHDKAGSGTGPELMVAQVAGKRLAVARSEVTVAEFSRFWQAGGSKTRAARPSCRDRESIFRSSKSRTWQSPGFTQQQDHPVTCVDYADVEAYTGWLSRQTGKRYRPLTAAEWTALAARTADAKSCRANVADQAFNAEHRDRDALACSDGFAATAPVKRFDAPGGLYDLAGNVREWVSDCASNCGSRVAMGSAWSSTADKLDPRQRMSFDADTGFNTIGFRVAREID